MKPVNNKSLIAFLFDQMDKLDAGTIDNQTAREQSNLAKQVNNSMKYELDRAKVLMELAQHNAIFKDGSNLREIESKNF
tara:strand:+ start:1263 stop:1499 length:237 start_codon:yes stop_codon:yes gene_type:complete